MCYRQLISVVKLLCLEARFVTAKVVVSRLPGDAAAPACAKANGDEGNGSQQPVSIFDFGSDKGESGKN